MLTSERAIYGRTPLLAESTFETLLEEIVRGDYRPRSRLRADDIAQRYGVSRTPVREALLRLAWMRFVVINRNSRTEVSDWGADDMRERLIMLERMASHAAVTEGEPVDTDELQRRFEALASPVDDVQLFLGVCLELVHSTFRRAGTHAVAALVRPLRLFYAPDVLRRHDIALEKHADRRRSRLNAAIDALAAGDRRRACRELERCASLIASATQETRWPNAPRRRPYPLTVRR